MQIGPALEGARTKAGMSVEDVSERTRIRRTIISDIEQGNYSSCGGDFYARGHIRAIAKAVGTDPVPLIAQYDDDVAARERAEAAAAAAVTGPDPRDWLESDSGARSLLSQLPLAGETGDSDGSQAHQAAPMAPRVAIAGLATARVRDGVLRAADRASPAIRDAVTGASRAGGQSAREASAWFRRMGSAAFDRFTRVRTGDELPSRVIGALAIFLAALIAVLYGIFSGPARSAPRPAVSRTHATGHPARTTPPARPASSHSPSSAPSAAAAGPLRPARAVAFGPGGARDGDNPQLAGHAISAKPGAGWNTNWYTTAEFGGLQSGTGLLIDLGSPATVTGVTVRLGPAGGALVQLRAGDTPDAAGLRTVTQDRSSGGYLTLSAPRPVQARYVLIWFTRLPRDAAGTYQATIYHVSVMGRSAGA